MQRGVQRCDYESLQADECASEKLMLTETSLSFSLSDVTFEMLLSNRTFSLAHQVSSTRFLYEFRTDFFP